MRPDVDLAGLNALCAEVFPRRTALSVVDLTFNNGAGAGATSTPAPSSDGGGGGSTVASSCTTTSSPGTPGLLGSLGLGSSQPYTSVTCVPTAVSGH